MTYTNPLCPSVCRLNIILQTDLISSVYYEEMSENASNMFSVDDERSTSKGLFNLSSAQVQQSTAVISQTVGLAKVTRALSGLFYHCGKILAIQRCYYSFNSPLGCCGAQGW